jgi:hypothetical protein
MTKEFIPYEQALDLKELGFDEPCFAHYCEGDLITKTAILKSSTMLYYQQNNINPNNQYKHKNCTAPLYQQAFRWFREKYNLQVYIDFYHKDSYFYKIKSQVGKEISNTTEDIILQGTPVFPRSYEEAELACLKKLIELVKNKNNE